MSSDADTDAVALRYIHIFSNTFNKLTVNKYFVLHFNAF